MAHEIKVVLAQTDSADRSVEENLERVLVSTSRYSPADEIDCVVFPELAFTRYNFPNREAAYDVAASAATGQLLSGSTPPASASDRVFSAMSQLAARLRAYVVFGYIEHEAGQLFDAVAVLDRAGQLRHNARKNHLYFNDLTWACAGSTFCAWELITLQGAQVRCTVAVGSDIHPADFREPAFELAQFLLASHSQVLILPMSWTDSRTQVVRSEDAAALLQYWLHRLKPVVAAQHPLLLLCSCRVGTEVDVCTQQPLCFFGATCAIRLGSTLQVIKNLNSLYEGYLVVETHL